MRRYLAIPLPLRIGLLASIGFLLVLACSPAHADLVIRNKQNGTELRLLSTPCSHAGTLAIIKPEYRPRFKNARGTLRGQMVYGCWLEEEDAAVLIFEDGSDTAIPMSAFQDTSV